jgi:hypothetical protein
VSHVRNISRTFFIPRSLSCGSAYKNRAGFIITLQPTTWRVRGDVDKDEVIMVPHQYSHTPQEAVINEYREWWTDNSPKNDRKDER